MDGPKKTTQLILCRIDKHKIIDADIYIKSQLAAQVVTWGFGETFPKERCLHALDVPGRHSHRGSQVLGVEARVHS